MPILPCPWCNGSPKTAQNGDVWYVVCNQCLAEGPWRPTEQQAIDDWESVARLRDDVRQLAERVAICSELLGKRAEKNPNPI